MRLFYKLIFILTFGLLSSVYLTHQQNVNAGVKTINLALQEPPVTSREISKPISKNDYIFLNSIDGVMYAIGKHDGKIKWSLKEEAVLKFPKNYENPYFLTDPRDGSLYVFNKRDGLKKFPYTIAELVSASPSKSSDGFLYTGDKKDQWLAIDYKTGHKLDTLTSESLLSKISSSDENIVFIGRTEYTISMFDINTRRKVFNITYYDYSTHATKDKVNRPSMPNANINRQEEEVEDANYYPYYHFSSSSDGTLVTLDKKTGEFKWELKLEFPIVAIYRYENEQLFKINYAIFAVEALTNLAQDPTRYKMLFKEQQLRELEGQNFSQQKPPTQNQQSTSTKNPPTNKIQNSDVFMSTLYIGFYKNNLYAMPSLIYNWQVPEIEGPKTVTEPTVIAQELPEDKKNLTQLENKANDNNSNGENTSTNVANLDNKEDSSTNTIVIGHHKLPEKLNFPPNYIQPNDKLIVMLKRENEQFGYLQDIFTGGAKQPLCPADKPKSKIKEFSLKYWKKFDQLMQNKYIWSMITVIVASLFPIGKMIYDSRKKRKRLQQKYMADTMRNGHVLEDGGIDDEEDEDEPPRRKSESQSNSHGTKNHSATRSGKSSKSHLTENEDSEKRSIHNSLSLPEITDEGNVKIGKISYDPKQILGHGCAGTFVYKGTFENRPVAVKRLLPECYTLADREVDLLRDADQHSNVLRYFCTESDVQFRYIALELCQMTLYDYVNKEHKLVHSKSVPNIPNLICKQPIRLLNILEQATKGLDHLHSLDIVHRDIKPQNVLLSFPNQKGEVLAMISDFGLCKRLEMGNNSFSKRSGITGTDGWIAPELIDDYMTQIELNSEPTFEADSNPGVEALTDEQKPRRVTKSVDIFSMGCVYYFVLSDGNHPFGDSIRRQANILSNEYKLDKLTATTHTELHVQKLIIEKMISKDPTLRPSTKQLLAHPIFWPKAKTLQFLQDVSDRIEKIEPDDPIMIELEKNANVVLKNNWKTHICPALQNDLRKFRAYNGVSVRDLLRAIRNKKHHYRELSDEVMKSLGSLPDGFVDYFTYRFPKLIIHVYEVMRCCADEPMLDVYYTDPSA